MNDKIILQLELKDTFFHISDIKPENLEYIEFCDTYIVIRNNFKECIETLNTEFDFAIWSLYPKEISDIIDAYLNSTGINILYQRHDATGFYRDNKFVSYGKRLKRLNHLNFSIDRIICIENEIPEFENYNNYFIIEPFYGQEDDVLISAAIELLKLSKVSDTRLIN